MFEESRKLGLPPAHTTTVIGRSRELERTFGEFVLAFGLSIAFIYMILAAQFENLVHPVTILLSHSMVTKCPEKSTVGPASVGPG